MNVRCAPKSQHYTHVQSVCLLHSKTHVLGEGPEKSIYMVQCMPFPGEILLPLLLQNVFAWVIKEKKMSDDTHWTDGWMADT